MSSSHTWYLDRSARADAPGIFVPHHELPDASIGDQVLLTAAGDEASDARAAVVAAIEDRDGVSYLRLDFDSPR